MTPELLERLAREAEAEAREAAATEGYFSADVRSEIDRSTEPWIVRLSVTPGEPTRISSVEIDLSGPAAADREATEVMQRIRSEWRLPVGGVFRQTDWDSAKRAAIATLSERRYAAAAISESEARIDPGARSAHLRVVLASGPAFHFGQIEVVGLEDYAPERVYNVATFRPGDPYERERLERFQRRVIALGYFVSVQVTLDTDPQRANAAPVRVAVIEAPAKRIDVGLGYSTDTQYRATLGWRHNNFLGRNWRLRNELRLEGKLQSAESTLEFPERPTGWTDSVTVRARRTDIQNLLTEGALVGVHRRSIEERSQPEFDLSSRVERQAPQGSPAETVYATLAEYWHTWRSTDDLITPRKGWIVQARVGASAPGLSTRTFGRGGLRAQRFIPLGRVDDLTLRAEAGAVLAGSSRGIPQSLLFRTGGDTTVRGYAYESLGVPRGEAIVGGRYYALASAEVTHWFGENWGIATFVDGGNAVDAPADFEFALGYGVGVRLRSPIGPLRADVAYGADTGKFRVHFSVGLAF
jgi:translocation and assembly module TamA